MNFEEICKIFRKSPTRMDNSVKLLMNRLNAEPEDIVAAKKLIRKEIGKTSGELRKEAAERRKQSVEYYRKSLKQQRILLLDIETTPIKAYVWDLWKQNIAWDHTTSDWYIICWSAKWLDSPDVYSECITPMDALQETDANILQPLWELLENADVVVTHNGDNFDLPRINTRFVLNGMTPPSPYYRIDTFKVAKKEFAFTSNKLDAIAHYFGLEGKYDTDFSLWEGCIDGNRKALQEMQEYNIQDVKVLEEVFLKMRPWIKGFPNNNNYMNSKTIVCATCGSDNIEELQGQYYYTSTGKYQLFRCKDCGAITKSRYNLNTPKNIKGTNVAR